LGGAEKGKDQGRVFVGETEGGEGGGKKQTKSLGKHDKSMVTDLAHEHGAGTWIPKKKKGIVGRGLVFVIHGGHVFPGGTRH